MIIIDTNILSEMMQPQAAAAVAEWMRSQKIEALSTTVISQAEILVGIATLRAGKRKSSPKREADQLFDEDFRGRVLAFDSSVATQFASLIALRRRAGRPISIFDAQIAAIALADDAELATRNVNDFIGCGFDIIGPWRFK